MVDAAALFHWSAPRGRVLYIQEFTEHYEMALISDHGGVKPPAQTSSKTHMAAGSGSRPVPSKYKIESSAPMDPKTLGRDVPGSLT